MEEYMRAPTIHQWKMDSSVRVKGGQVAYIDTDRGSDKVLRNIDSIVEALPNTPLVAVRLILYGDLFFCLEHWLKRLSQNNPAQKNGRKPAIQALHNLVVRYLCSTLQEAGTSPIGLKVTPIQTSLLRKKLELYWGGRWENTAGI